MKYRREIDGLRAVAVLPVILFHAGFSLFSGGFVGVDVFFVISGYLITTIIYSELQQGDFSMVRFWERRARRILPALFVVMLASLIFAWQWLLPQQMRGFAQSLVASSTFSSNILFWKQVDYFDPAAEVKPLLHTWSLAIEEQYYLLFPIFMVIAYRMCKHQVALVLATVALVSLALAEHMSSSSPTTAYFLLPTRGWELLVGGLLSFIYIRRKDRVPVHALDEVASLVGLLMIAYASITFDKLTPFPSVHALIPVLGAALVIVHASAATFVGRLLSTSPLTGIGLISYSAYLWHQPVFALARERSLNDLSVTMLVVCIGLTLGLAYLSWKFVEAPFRDRQFMSQKGVFAFGIIGSGLFVAVGVAGHLSNGFPARYDAETLAYASAASARGSRTHECNTGGIDYMNPRESCVLGDKDKVIGALIGDSHADAISHALDEALNRKGFGMRQMTYGGCAPAQDLFRSGEFRCAEYNAKVAAILADPDIKSVIVMARWSVYLKGTGFDNGEGGVEYGVGNLWVDAGVNQMDSSRPYPLRKQAVTDAFRKAVTDLLAADKKVILVYPVPEMGWDVPEYAAKKFRYTGDASVSISYQRYLRHHADIIKVFDDIGDRRNLIRIRPDRVFCDTWVRNRCVATLAGEVLYFDDDHLSDAGARYLVRLVADNL